MKDETIVLSIEMSQINCFFATPGRTICAWRIGKYNDQRFFIREIYNGDKECVYTKFGEYRHVSKI